MPLCFEPLLVYRRRRGAGILSSQPNVQDYGKEHVNRRAPWYVLATASPLRLRITRQARPVNHAFRRRSGGCRLIVDANRLRYSFRSGRRPEKRRRPHGREGDMPSYKAPVDDVMFLLSDVFHIDRYNNLPGFRRRHARSGRGSARRGGEVLRGRADAAQPRRRQGRLPAPRRTARSPRRPGSRTPTNGSPKAAGSALRRRPNSAARACRWRSRRPSANSCAPPTWPLPCIRA